MDDEFELPTNVSRLDSHAQTLARRLHDGWDRIEAAALAGEDVERWEAFWIDLLRQYEAVCDERESLAA